jgi:nucleotide-binding universal stress UspA family protein
MAADGPILLCFDGSEDAAAAIAHAGRVLSHRDAIVLSVWEPISVWAPYDPATVLSAPLERLAASGLELDSIAAELAGETAERGARLAREAGFRTETKVAGGRVWRTVCDVAEELGAEAIVMGSRGLGRVGGVLLGSVSSAVVVHAGRPVLIVPHPRSG